MKYTKKIPMLKMVWIHRWMLWTSLVGLFASTYLSITYLTGKPIVCGLLTGCEIVRASSWATTFGIPRPLLGLVFYGAIILSLVIRTYAPRHRPDFWKAITLLATFCGFVESGFLTLVQTFSIRAFCTWCLLSAVCATVLFILSFFEGDEHLSDLLVARELKMIFTSFAVALVVGGLLIWGMLTKSVGGSLPTISAPGQAGMSDILPADIPYEGPATSTVTITEFLDLQCPACREYYAIMKQIRDDYRGKIRFAIRIFPLYEMHPNAKISAAGVLCAGKQGKYYDFIDAALLNQDALQRDDLMRYAGALHLDAKAFGACLDDPATADAVMAGRKAGEALGITGTPTLFLNDAMLSQPPDYQQFKQLIDQRLK